MLGLLLRCAGVRDVTGTARPDAARQRWWGSEQWLPPGGGDGRRGRPI